MAYFAYYRVSTGTQAEKGGGLEMQRQGIEKYCSLHEITITDSFTDAGISGAVRDDETEEALSKRPALFRMIATLKPGDSVIVLNTSRLWRSDTAKVLIRRELKKRHAHVISVENPRFDIYAQNPNDRLMDGIMELMDEWERMTIAHKLSNAREAKAHTGWKPSGQCPYGYRYSEEKTGTETGKYKTIEQDPREAQAVKLMFTEAQRGKSLRQIADILNADGVPTRRGRPWSAGTVQAILKNRFYVGDIIHDSREKRSAPGYKPDYRKGKHRPIISKVQFGKVQAQLAKRKR